MAGSRTSFLVVQKLERRCLSGLIDLFLTSDVLHPCEALSAVGQDDDADGQAFEHSMPIHAAAPRPDLILLNLNLPRMDGREVLALIKADDSLKSIPTVILTTSEAEADIVKSYHLQANCYLSKPVELEAFENLVKSINDFWLTRAKLPREQEFT